MLVCYCVAILVSLSHSPNLADANRGTRPPRRVARRNGFQKSSFRVRALGLVQPGWTQGAVSGTAAMFLLCILVLGAVTRTRTAGRVKEVGKEGLGDWAQTYRCECWSIGLAPGRRGRKGMCYRIHISVDTACRLVRVGRSRMRR